MLRDPWPYSPSQQEIPYEILVRGAVMLARACVVPFGGSHTLSFNPRRESIDGFLMKYLPIPSSPLPTNPVSLLGQRRARSDDAGQLGEAFEALSVFDR